MKIVYVIFSFVFFASELRLMDAISHFVNNMYQHKRCLPS